MTKVLIRPNANVHSNKYQSFTKTSEVKKQFSKFHSLLRNNKHRRMLISCSLVIDDNNLYNDCTISPASTPTPPQADKTCIIVNGRNANTTYITQYRINIKNYTIYTMFNKYLTQIHNCKGYFTLYKKGFIQKNVYIYLKCYLNLC